MRESALVLVSLLIIVFYYAMDASDFGGIIDDFNKYQLWYSIIAFGIAARMKGVFSKNGKK
ncbi:MAG: hypothetical protein U9P07_00205 [Pseudomonadota bacterium]|nr:hypothetical protein [Pseudomonadota bacterium]